MIETQENGEKPNFGHNLGPLCLNSGHQFLFITLLVRHCSKLSLYAI